MIRTAAKSHTNIRTKIQFPYEIAIPTLQNPVLLRDTTLNILKAYRIPFRKITIFVPSIAQEKLYKSTLFPNTYGKLYNTSTTNLADHYNGIYSYYTPGTQVIFIKDCIKYILEYNSAETTAVRQLRSVLALCKLGFLSCEKEGAHLWGLSPNVSGMKQTITTSFQYIPGSLWGTIIPFPASIHLTQSYKEDYERTIQYYKADKTVIRLNMASAIECNQPVDIIELQSSIKNLIQLYPEYIAQKKSEPSECMLRTQKLT
jgi:hypothetical protein